MEEGDEEEGKEEEDIEVEEPVQRAKTAKKRKAGAATLAKNGKGKANSRTAKSERLSECPGCRVSADIPCRSYSSACTSEPTCAQVPEIDCSLEEETNPGTPRRSRSREWRSLLERGRLGRCRRPSSYPPACTCYGPCPKRTICGTKQEKENDQSAFGRR